MTDRQALAAFRLEQAKETLADAKTMLHSAVSPRSVINRTYYVMFYAVLALCHHAGSEVTTSKHSGIISLFDKEFIHTGKLGKKYSQLLHKAFELRQTVDYKEMIDLDISDAQKQVSHAQFFLEGIIAAMVS